MADMLMKEALQRYLERVSVLKKGLKQEKYRIEQIKRSFLGDLNVADVTSVHISSYRDWRLNEVKAKSGKAISPASVRLEMSLLSHFFVISLNEWGLCKDNPVIRVRKPKPPPGRDRRLTPRESRQILRYAHEFSNADLYSIIVIALESAMRQGEILSLRWENINLRSRVARLDETKNGSKRDVPLSMKAIQALTHVGVKSHGPVFKYTSHGIRSTWRYMVQKLNIEDLNFHDLRHEATSRLFELGTLDMMEVAAITGHKSLSMLKRYTHLRASRLAKKLEVGHSRSRRAILQWFVPYPMHVRQIRGMFVGRLLDFNITIIRPSLEKLLEAAPKELSFSILSYMKDPSKDVPLPDQYLDPVDESEIFMLEPLPIAA